MKLKLLVIFLSLFFTNISEAAMEFVTHHGKLTLENEAKIGEIVIIKQVVIAGYDEDNAEIGCFFPEGLELINDNGYNVSFVEPPASLKKGTRVIFYSGPIKKGDVKEAVFKVLIPDGNKYIINGGGPNDPEGKLEIDLGEPEPPEWRPQDKEIAGIKEGKLHILSGIKQMDNGQLLELTIPQDSMPPIRAELQIRTKDRPYYDYRTDTIIPVRYLVYAEEESTNLKVTLAIPPGLEFIKESPYEASTLANGQEGIVLYSGPMRAKECKPFYFKVKAVSSAQQNELPIIAISQISDISGRELIKEDKLIINIGPSGEM